MAILKRFNPDTQEWEAAVVADPRNADLAKAWATGTEPDGPGTKSSREWADEAAASASRQVDSVEELRAASFPEQITRLWLSGYYGVGTAGGGPLYRDDSDTTSADNGGTVLVDLDGVRWKRPETSTIPVDWFGARRDDNITDDQPAVQAAIDSTDGPVSILFGAGTYYFSKEVTYRSNVSIVGLGIGVTVIEMTAHGDAFRSPSPNKGDGKVEDVHFSGMTIDGRKDSLGVSGTIYPGDVRTAGIRIINTNRFTVERVRGQRHSAYAVECKLSSIGVIDQCFAWNNADDGISVSDIGKFGVNDAEGIDILVSNCVSWENTTEAGQRTGSGFEVDDGPQNVQFANCIAHDNEGEGFDLHAHSDAPGPSNVQFVNCISYNNEKSGFYSRGDAGNTNEWQVPRDISFFGCRSFGNGQNGFFVINSMRPNYHNCQAYLNGEHGFVFNGMSGGLSSDGVLSGNFAWANSQSSDQSFSNFRVLGAPSRLLIEGNRARKGEQDNKPDYGAYIGTGGHTIKGNDWEDGGSISGARISVDGFVDLFEDTTVGERAGGEAQYFSSGTKVISREITLEYSSVTRLARTWFLNSGASAEFVDEPQITVTPKFPTLSSENLSHADIGVAFAEPKSDGTVEIYLYKSSGAPDFTVGDTITVMLEARGKYREPVSFV